MYLQDNCLGCGKRMYKGGEYEEGSNHPIRRFVLCYNKDCKDYGIRVYTDCEVMKMKYKLIVNGEVEVETNDYRWIENQTTWNMLCLDDSEDLEEMIITVSTKPREEEE